MKKWVELITLIFSFLKNFNKSMDMDKLKRFSDFNFFIIEKIIFYFNIFSPYYFKFYEEMVNEEIKLANISSNDRILHIGCGSIPVTSIIIAEKTGAKINAIDIDHFSSEKAKKFIEQNTNFKNIIIKYADGADYSLSGFDIIIVSDGVKKLIKILHNIGKSANKNVKVIFRKTISINKNFNLDDYYLGNYLKIEEIKTHESYGNFSSILLSKKL